jgi:hypothetical protein
VKIDNSCIERVEEFKYLVMMLRDQNSIQEEIKSRVKLGNACYHSMQNLLSSRLLSKNLKIKIYRTIILPVVLYGCETWSLTLREERRLRVSRMGEDRGMHRVLMGKPDGKRPLGRPRRRWEDNIKMDLEELGGGRGDWMELAQDRDRWRTQIGRAHV